MNKCALICKYRKENVMLNGNCINDDSRTRKYFVQSEGESMIQWHRSKRICFLSVFLS